MLTDIDLALLDAPWPGEVATGPKTRLGIGLIWRKLGEVPIYSRKLSVAEVHRRIERCYMPYHAALDAAIEGAYAGFGAVWHLNVHSMPDDSYARLGLADKPLADFVLGDLDGRTAGEEVMALIEGVLREHGYSVARNDPFKGVEHHRSATAGRPNAAIRCRSRSSARVMPMCSGTNRTKVSCACSARSTRCFGAGAACAARLRPWRLMSGPAGRGARLQANFHPCPARAAMLNPKETT